MTLEQMKALVESSRAVRFSIEGREALYQLLVNVLRKHRYGKLDREQRGIVRGFLMKVTGRSRAQITRLIGQWMQVRTIKAKPQPVGGSRPGTPPKMRRCWPRLMPRMRSCPDQRRAGFYGVNTRCSAEASTSG